VRELACPARRAISSTAIPDSDIKLTNVWRNFLGDHEQPIPAFSHTARKPRRTFASSSGLPVLLVKTKLDR
jgi:hypothetical protein